mgnify:CR=1 FL=1
MDQTSKIKVDPIASESRVLSFLRQLSKNKVAFGSLIFLLVIHIVVFLGPLIWKVNPEAVDPRNELAFRYR